MNKTVSKIIENYFLFILINLILKSVNCGSGSSWNEWWAYEGISG